jgi:uncharacterized OsmC-like protein
MSSIHEIAAAMQRVESVLRRRPQSAVHDDAPATAKWEGGLRIVSSHKNGHSVPTDMSREFGGTGDQVSPGWLFRAGLASCAATCIAMAAAAEGIELTTLEVKATSRSDTRGLFGIEDVSGETVSPGPSDVQLHVRIAARDVPDDTLRQLVEKSQRCSPIPTAVKQALPVELLVNVAE